MEATDVRQAGPDRLEERTGGVPARGRIEVLLLDVGGVLVPFPDPMAVARVERELALAGLRRWQAMASRHPATSFNMSFTWR